MKAIKFMISGAMLILLGPIMSLVDFSFSGFMVICWFVGVPLFVAGLIVPADGAKPPKQLEDFPQQPLVILTQLSTHIQYMLEGLLHDQSLKDEDVRTMAVSLEGMEYNFEEVSAELKDALSKCYKNRFSVVKNKATKKE